MNRLQSILGTQTAGPAGSGLDAREVATLPAAAAAAGQVFMVTDGFDGGPCLAWCDGAAWWVLATRMGKVTAAPSVSTIVAGEVTALGLDLMIDTEAGAATDDLDTINGGASGQILRVSAENDTHTVVLKNGTGNLTLSADVVLDSSDDVVLLIRYGTDEFPQWYQLAPVANNGV